MKGSQVDEGEGQPDGIEAEELHAAHDGGDIARHRRLPRPDAVGRGVGVLHTEAG